MTRLLFLALIILSVASSDAADRDVRREARSILSDKCFTCHGPDADAREADLRLDNLAGATADLGGRVAIKPGDPTASEVMARLRSTDPDERMPPPDAKEKISEDEINLLETWIRQGASYDQHWAFQPLNRPPPPIDASDASSTWPRTGIDSFILRRLREANLAPSKEASRPTLIRRVHLDLLGLPPTPHEVQQFVNDAAPNAYDRMVERVLASPHYGERWGRHWLDQARYADTHGYTVDTERTMWPYRDWVINAINQDMPFDQFTIEQLAGDLLPNPTQPQLVATGFHRNTLVNQEGGSDREQFRNEAAVDRVNTTGAVWMGLTIGCAQCHHHKFDPISQRDYYQLFAFFNNQEDANNVGPTVKVVSAEARQRIDELEKTVRDARQAIEAYDKSENDNRAADQKDDGKPLKWTIVEIAGAESKGGAKFERLEDGSWVVSGDNADQDTYSLIISKLPARVTALRLETLTHPSLPQGGPGRAGNGNFVLNKIDLTVGEQAAQWLHATADHSQADYDVSKAIDGDLKTGWAINVTKGRMNVNRTAVFVSNELKNGDGAGGAVHLQFGPTPAKYNIGRFRLSVTDAPHAKLELPDPQRKSLQTDLAKAQKALDAYTKSFPSTMIMRELSKPRESHIHIRGDFLRKGDPVTPDVPASLPPLVASDHSGVEAKQADATTSALTRNRLDLARWLVDERNPLTARVTVNRIWGRMFGKGLVETENDFGMQSTAPTHPELLDWLASELVRGDWSIKRLHRLIVCSSVYRQSSDKREDLVAADPLNQWLGRQNRIRVEAEIVRDLSLAASGLLSPRIGGPSVRPPQPDGVYAFTQRNASWPTSQGSDRYRRGLYTFFMRSAPYPMLTTFDTPRFNTTCTQRVRSNTPLQSLTMANDEAMMEAARALGRRLAFASGSDAARLDEAYQICFARQIDPVEAKVLLGFLSNQRNEFQEDPTAAFALLNKKPDDKKQDNSSDGSDESSIELAAWTAVSRVLMNLDEFIVRE